MGNAKPIVVGLLAMALFRSVEVAIIGNIMFLLATDWDNSYSQWPRLIVRYETT